MSVVSYKCKFNDAKISSEIDMFVHDEFKSLGHELEVSNLFKFKTFDKIHDYMIERTFLSIRDPFSGKEVEVFPIEFVYHSTVKVEQKRILLIGSIMKLLKLLTGNEYKPINNSILDLIDSYREDDFPDSYDLDKIMKSDVINNLSYHIDDLKEDLSEYFQGNCDKLSNKDIQNVFEKCVVNLPVNDTFCSTVIGSEKITNKHKLMENIFNNKDQSHAELNYSNLFPQEDVDISTDMYVDNGEVNFYKIAQFIHTCDYKDLLITINDTGDIDIEYENKESYTDDYLDMFKVNVKLVILESVNSEFAGSLVEMKIHKNSCDEQCYEITRRLNNGIKKDKLFIDGTLLQLVTRCVEKV